MRVQDRMIILGQPARFGCNISNSRYDWLEKLLKATLSMADL